MPESIKDIDGLNPIGPYSLAVRAGQFLFISGSLGLIPHENKLAVGGIRGQTEQALQNLKLIIVSSGGKVENTVKITIFLKNMTDFSTVNEIYAGFFKDFHPARSTVEVASLPLDALVEIDAIVELPS